MSGDQGGGVGGDTCGREIKVQQQHAAQMEELWVTERKDGGDNGISNSLLSLLFFGGEGWLLSKGCRRPSARPSSCPSTAR